MMCLALALFFALASPLCAEEKIFTGSGDWNDVTLWGGALPAAGDAVVIRGEVSLTNSTPLLASFTIDSDCSVTCDNWETLISADTVAINGTLTHAVNSAIAADATTGEWIPNARVNIACTDLTVGEGGIIDVEGMGYGGTPEGANSVGYGPGAGLRTAFGGSHGGRGGCFVYQNRFYLETSTAEPYDSETEPSQPGSGGYSQDRLDGGCGGGVVRIAAVGTVTVDGAIDADGTRTQKRGNHYVGGAGGAIYISCNTIAGSGAITASGGNARQSAGGGGGGRIAIVYDVEAQAALALPELEIRALGGSSTYEQGYVYSATKTSYALKCGWAFYEYSLGELGTLYFPDSQFLTRLEATGGTFRLGGRWVAPDAPETLTFNGDLRFEKAALQVDTLRSFSVNGSLVLVGEDDCLGWINGNRSHNSSMETRSNFRLQMTNCAFTVTGDLIATNAFVGLDAENSSVGGDLIFDSSYLSVKSTLGMKPKFTVEGDASFSWSFGHIYANGADNVEPASMSELADSGCALFSVKGKLALMNRSGMFPHSDPLEGGSPWFCCDSLEIDESSIFDATAIGYAGYKDKVIGSGRGRSGDGWTGGGYKIGQSHYNGTGGYGGRGGNTTNMNDIVYGATYDSAFAPFGPGSCGANGEAISACGAGAIRIICAGEVVLNGAMKSIGSNLNINWAAASSGGAIWVICNSFSGSSEAAELNVTGGNGGGNSFVPGAGGRIAIWTNWRGDNVSDLLFSRLLSGSSSSARQLEAFDEWFGSMTASTGTVYKSNNTIFTNPENGTIALLSLQSRTGMLLFVR